MNISNKELKTWCCFNCGQVNLHSFAWDAAFCKYCNYEQQDRRHTTNESGHYCSYEEPASA